MDGMTSFIRDAMNHFHAGIASVLNSDFKKVFCVIIQWVEEMKHEILSIHDTAAYRKMIFIFLTCPRKVKSFICLLLMLCVLDFSCFIFYIRALLF